MSYTADSIKDLKHRVGALEQENKWKDEEIMTLSRQVNQVIEYLKIKPGMVPVADTATAKREAIGDGLDAD
ncbi:MAG: hypothetical protein M0R06_02530 [Sphaerochaeta sp.]|nr:hypothetical protein [Sphaerochaeta sp.]